ncbi:hypothetical protein C7974DRAFT_420056 [Boeremia exigua]|uniref:uncharacterized protein n=1 Tax=Boeremia exigua TaxID=749465 RepID=UPI001E8ED3BB|nr:uncharacterized protein C7974DRAFT_420056 [Boeremia exigua]KAH6644589.1 hypothetical protein C7974DRAFT_420056 [Boeremia exigua]
MADRFKNLAKNGWHPEKSKAGGSGGTSDSKLGQVKGWVGKAQGKDSHAEAAREHQSAPLSTLKDPSSFAPPPKRVPGASPVAGGVGAAPPGSARQRLQEKEEAQRRAAQESKPQGPYRPDTTGLSTTHLPKPPAFRPNAATPPPAPAPRAKPPGLPPRLPPRQTENVDEYTPPAPPSYGEAIQPAAQTLNQGALNRLGQAGVTVPGFGIDRNASPPVPPRQRTVAPPPPARQASSSSAAAPVSPPASAGNGPQLNELQSRFAKMSASPASETAPSTGTSWADKQAALRTASNLRNDPSQISGSDLKSAASTANNFQQRHGEQAASGWRAANGLNQKYGIAGRVNSLAGGANTSGASQPPAPGGLGKKPPPPPPAKKAGLTSNSSGEPPPIPLSSKPKF